MSSKPALPLSSSQPLIPFCLGYAFAHFAPVQEEPAAALEDDETLSTQLNQALNVTVSRCHGKLTEMELMELEMSQYLTISSPMSMIGAKADPRCTPGRGTSGTTVRHGVAPVA